MADASIEVRDLALLDIPAAAALLGRGMRDNPLHRRAFGENPARREADLAGLFAGVLPRTLREGTILGAFTGGRLDGVCAMVAPGRCRLTIVERARLAPRLLAALGPARLAALLRWTGAWERRDPAEPHWHLGPVGVERERQGQGVGSALLAEFVRRTAGTSTWLETDKSENVKFYQRFGFVVIREEPVLGTPGWFMRRAAGGLEQSAGGPHI
jgi:ribosomal protein S18 acetylase RimI-like enzyme